jgi:hypothetical protein
VKNPNRGGSYTFDGTTVTQVTIPTAERPYKYRESEHETVVVSAVAPPAVSVPEEE